MNVNQESFEPLVDEIKQEFIECETPKLKQQSDLLINIDHDYIGEYECLQNVPVNIEKERKVTDLCVDFKDITQEPFEFVQPKSESELSTLLTAHCDLPILEDEFIAHPSCLDQPNNNKQAEIINKSLKDTHIHVSKKRSRISPCPVGQNSKCFFVCLVVSINPLSKINASVQI